MASEIPKPEIATAQPKKLPFILRPFAVWLVIGFVAVTYIGGGFVLYKHYFVTDPTFAGTFGDMFGGITSFFSAFTVIIVFFAARLQKEELDATRSELIKQVESSAELSRTANLQNQNLVTQRFEATLFNLINIHNQNLEELVKLSPPSSKPALNNSVREVEERFKNTSTGTYYIFHRQDLGDFIAYYNVWPNDNVKALKLRYLKHVTNILRFIERSSVHDGTRRLYLSIYISLLSENEMKLIFFHIAFDKEINKEHSTLRTFCAMFDVFKDVKIEIHESYNSIFTIENIF